MSDRPKALLCWSSGKDSDWTLHVLRRSREVEVAGLLTTINEAHDRVAMHAVRVELLQAQAEAVGLPLWTVPIPSPCSDRQYEAAMGAAVQQARTAGITVMAFGDLFPRGCASIPGIAAARHRVDADVSPLGAVHGFVGARDDCSGFAGPLDLRRSEANRPDVRRTGVR